MTDYLTYLAGTFLASLGTTGAPWAQIVAVAMVVFAGMALLAYFAGIAGDAVSAALQLSTRPKLKARYGRNHGNRV